MQINALFIGNSDGIGLSATNRFLKKSWNITGISRSESSITRENYKHHVCDVAAVEYSELLNNLVQDNQYDYCIHFAGIGELLDPLDMSGEANIIEVNLLSMVRTAAVIIPSMVKLGRGHFIGLSSVADELISAQAPSYHASKAGYTNYLRGLALALEPKLLLLDEPMAGMNVEEKETMARFIVDIYEQRKIPILLIEHDMGVVMDIADRVVVLDFGIKIAEGRPAGIIRNEKVLNAYLGSEEAEFTSARENI